MLRFCRPVSLLALGAACLAALPAGAAELPHLRALTEDGARVSALVVDLDQRAIIAELNPRQRLTPASITKLYVAAAALKRWGPDHRFTTRLLTGGAIENGVLHGDLVLLGSGDPSLDHARLWRLAMRLRQRGVHTVDGDLIVNNSLFGPVVCITVDRCEAREYSENSYDAPVSSAGTNFSNVEVTVIPADAPGEPAALVFMPPGLTGFAIEGEVKTVPAGERARISAWRETEYGRSTVSVSGQVPVGGGPYSVLRSVPYPAHYTAKMLATVLALSGVKVTGQSAVVSTPVPEGYRSVASVVSPSLANQLRNMMAYSNNYMADVLTLDLLAYAPQAPETPVLALPRAGQILAELARGANAEAERWLGPPLQETPLAIDTGSGLSVTNKLSAHDVVALLAHMYREPGLFPAFLGSLAVPDYTPSGLLQGQAQAWGTRVAVKSGTLTEPVTVRAVAGYFRFTDGGWGAFAVLVNGGEGWPHIPIYTAIDALRADLLAILAEY